MLRRGEDRATAEVVGFDTDRHAVEAARRDPRLFEALYRKYVAQVYTFALYELRDRHAAEDATAQVFLRALAGLPGFREREPAPHSSFRVWLFQICRNTFRNERRRHRRHPEAPLEAALGVPAADDVTAHAVERDQVQRALAAIDALPVDRRRAIVLRFVHEMTAREIGEVMGKSDAAVRVAIHRGLRSVAARLAGERRPAD